MREKIGNRRVGMAGAGLLFLVVSGVAYAESRVETGGATPMRERVHLDFTIVVPPFLSIARAMRAGEGGDDNAAPQLRPRPAAGKDSFIVLANAGTVALAPARPRPPESPAPLAGTAGAEDAPAAVYSVALP